MMNEIKVLMLGGKRCGKTTVLSSMFGSINEALAGTGLAINVDPETSAALNRARSVIINKMREFEEPLTSCEVEENPSDAARSYSFYLNSMGDGRTQGGIVPFTIYDIPGEWLTDENVGRVKGLIKECQVIIIAIDTPYLSAKMTDKGYGQYHEEANKPVEITNFFKDTLSVEDLQDRMILFVPLKCERYYHLDRSKHLREFGRRYMSEVTKAVYEGYKDLIHYLRSCEELTNSCTIAVTPILSAGGIDFISFKWDEEAQKMVSYYQAPEFVRDDERGYCPKFCEQPLVYILSYILYQVIKNQQMNMNMNMNNGRRLFHVASNMNTQQMQSAFMTIRNKMKRNNGIAIDEDGYFIVQNPLNL